MIFEDLEAYILSDGLDDWVMLGAIAEAAVAFGIAKSTSDARELTVAAVERLLSEHLIDVGDIGRDGRFHAREESLIMTIERLKQVVAADDINAWYAAAWINLTEHGKAVASQIDGI